MKNEMKFGEKELAKFVKEKKEVKKKWIVKYAAQNLNLKRK